MLALFEVNKNARASRLRPLPTRWLGIGLLAMLQLLAACDESSLSGSLSDYYDTSFETVRARLYSSELTIEYVRKNGEVPVRVSLRRATAAIGAGKYSLTERGRVTGRTGDTDIPAFVSGTLTLGEFSETQGAKVSGSFSASFETGKDELTLSGSFSTTLEVIGAVSGFEVDGYPPPEELSELEDEAESE